MADQEGFELQREKNQPLNTCVANLFVLCCLANIGGYGYARSATAFYEKNNLNMFVLEDLQNTSLNYVYK